jgi:phosphoglycerate dehydrogenase-like enzyme
VVTVLFRDPDAVSLMNGLPAGVQDVYWDGQGLLPAAARSAEVFVPAAPVTGHDLDLIPRLPVLRLVQLCSSGADAFVGRIPPGVLLCTASANGRYVAEWVVGALIAAQRELPRIVRAQDAHVWSRRPTSRLIGKTVMIYGYGSIGRHLARQLAAFEVTVVPVAATARPGVHAAAEVLGLLPGCDAVVVLVPLTDRTRGLVGAEFLAQLADGSLLVCASRGPVVDARALQREVAAGRIRAVLDVTDPEPLPPDSPLWDAPGVLISPHVAGLTDQTMTEAFAVVKEQLERFVAGRPLAHQVGADGY